MHPTRDFPIDLLDATERLRESVDRLAAHAESDPASGLAAYSDRLRELRDLAEMAVNEQLARVKPVVDTALKTR